MLGTIILISLVLLAFIFLSSACRFALSKLLKTDIHLAEGFVGLVALQHIIAAPILYMNASFRTYYVLLLVTLTLLVVPYAVSLVRRFRTNKHTFFSFKRALPKTAYVAIGLVLLLLIITQIFIRYNHDDSFNIAMITQSVDDPSLYTTEFSTGDPDFPIVPFYQFMSWELFLAGFVKTSTLTPNIVAHTVVPIVIIGLAYAAYRRLFRALFKNDRQADIATIGLIGFHVFGTISRFMPGVFLLGGSWRGKSIIVALVLPLILTRLLELYQAKSSDIRPIVIVLLVLSVGASALNPSSIYLLLSCFVPFGLYLLIRKKFRKALLLAVPAIPLFILGGFIVAESKAFAEIYSPISDAPLTLGLWDNVVQNYFGVHYGLVIAAFLLSALYFLLNRKNYLHVHLIWPAVILLMTFLNPYAIGFVSEQFTSPATYWRLYWIIPLGIVFASLFAIVCTRDKKRRIPLVAASLLLFSIFAIKPWDNLLFTEKNGFSTVKNIEKIPESIPETVETILADGGGTVLAYEPGSIYARTITKDIDLIWSRQQYFLGYLDPASTEFNERQNLFLFAEAKQGWDDFEPSYYQELLERYGVDWFWTTADRYAEVQSVVSGKVIQINNEVLVKLQ